MVKTKCNKVDGGVDQYFGCYPSCNGDVPLHPKVAEIF